MKSLNYTLDTDGNDFSIFSKSIDLYITYDLLYNLWSLLGDDLYWRVNAGLLDPLRQHLEENLTP